MHQLCKTTLLWIAILLLMPTASQAKETLGKDLLPLMAWDYADDEPTLRAMAECGINLVAFVPPKALDTCQKLGIQAIVFDPEITPARWDQPFQADRAAKVLPALIKKVNNHPAVYGYHLKDEPDPTQFAELAKSVAMVRELAPGKWPYINLTPGMGTGYDGYLNSFIDTCHPTILSYDNYPLGQDGSFSYGYWANMAQVRSAAVRSKLPFWTIFLSVAHLTYAEPTPAGLRLEAYGALAYGARGLCYYKFISRELPILEAPDLGDWRGAPLDQFGAKTEAWNWVRNMNRQIQNIAPALLKLRSDAVYHVGEVPEQNRGIGPDTLVKGLSAGDAFIIGDFTSEEDGSRWVMIVNKHLKNSVPCRPEFTVPPERVEYVSPITGELKPFPAPWYCLPPGQGVLLKLVTKPAVSSEKDDALHK
ncbi:MAG: hypothetical protein U0805_18260 [Pirellulales bacterium]